jgi:hypothetical protein
MSDGGSIRVGTMPTTLFVCSAGHSGSTLLDLLLGSHPAALSLGEITHLPKNVALNTECTCGAKVRDCGFWRPLLDRLATEPQFGDWRVDPYKMFLGFIDASNVIDRRHQTPLRRLYRRLVFGSAYASWRWGIAPLDPLTAPVRRAAANKQLFFRIVAESAGKSVLVDSSKHYIEAVSLYRIAPAHTRVLVLIRDGRAVFYSYLKRGWPRRDALNAWKHTYERGLPLIERLIPRSDRLEVRYENLARHPESELRRICAAAGLPFDERMLEFRSGTRHLLNGNNMRFKADKTIRPDEAWRTALSATDLRYFEKHAGELNRRLGYRD